VCSRDNPKKIESKCNYFDLQGERIGDRRSSYRPIGLANTLYKLWTRLITNRLYEHAEANSLLGNMQAGFCKKHDTIQQLQNVLMTLEDAKL
jgi:hypothetical protein